MASRAFRGEGGRAWWAALALAIPLPVAAQLSPPIPIERHVLWDIGAALPDQMGETQADALRIERLRAFPLGSAAQPEGLLVCLTLAFPQVEAGLTRVVVTYDVRHSTGLRLSGAPFFHGLAWSRGEVPLADQCEAAERNAASVPAPVPAQDRPP